MKRLSNLTATLFLMLLLVGCGSDKDTPSPEGATFRVEIEQTGEYEKFNKIISFLGGEFYRTGTKEEMPTILFDEHLTNGSYSYEAEGVRELKIQTTVGFSPVEDAPAQMGINIKVYRNGTLLDETKYSYTENSDGVNEFLTYKAN